ncbi:MAG: choice-of-anchor I family protein [Planctomycetota bacterium]
MLNMTSKAAAAAGLASLAAPAAVGQIKIEFLSRYETGLFDAGGAEIVAYDGTTQRLFVTRSGGRAIDAVCISDPSNPVLDFQIDIGGIGSGDITSVAVSKDGIVAAAIEGGDQLPGFAAFFNADGELYGVVQVGHLPDMITFTPDGAFALTANEGEPNNDYTLDPQGSVSIINVPRRNPYAFGEPWADRMVRTVSLHVLNDKVLDESVRVFGPDASVAQDLEPEFIAVGPDSEIAYVSCQENNCLLVIDISRAKLTDVIALGFKDHSLPGNGLDASDRDNAINITNWPVFGMYQPDSIATFKSGGQTYLVTANEGDAREYEGDPGFVEVERIGDILLDTAAFPDAATLQLDENLGRLEVTNTLGDPDADGDFDSLFSFGARSFSVHTADGARIFDSGDALAKITVAYRPKNFNSNGDENDGFDGRSDDAGPEPEAITTGIINGVPHIFVGLERFGGVAVYEASDPSNPTFVDYINTRNFDEPAASGSGGDLSPEGIVFIGAEQSPTRHPLIAVAYEISGTTSIYAIRGSDHTDPANRNMTGTSSEPDSGSSSPAVCDSIAPR